MSIACTETTLSVNGYRLAAQEWNPEGAIKVIACHGWLDNSASFLRLAPLLTACHVLALDLPGHGCSDHKPQQATYNIWDDLVDIAAVADAMQWQQFHLLGHSRGAMMGLLLAAAMPERVHSLVMLDGLVPVPVEHADTAQQLGRFIRDNLRGGKSYRAGYESIDRAIQVRCKAIGMSEESARPIVERALVLREGRYQWRSDSRLTNASAVKLTDSHNRALLDSLQVPTLLLVTDRGVASQDYFRALMDSYPKLNSQILRGSHHFHMESPATDAAGEINRFYAGLGLGACAGEGS